MAKPSTNADIAASTLLLLAAVAALVVANSPFAETYFKTLKTVIPVGFGGYVIDDALKDWIKNALMGVFFIFIGLEIKAEFKEGALSSRDRAILPFTGAVGGMAAPAVIYLAIVGFSPQYSPGWAIPSATDIAFAVGVVGLLGKIVPPALKAFLLAVAVIDDLGAILIIAFFYTAGLDWVWMAATVAICGVLWVMNARGVSSIPAYLAVGVVLWVAIYHTGVTSTLAGVVVALFIPLKSRDGSWSPLHSLVSALKAPVNFFIMPVFAFANAGVPLGGLGLADLTHPITMGIAMGLLVGKPIGITLLVWLTVRSGVARLPDGSTWMLVLGVAFIAGIGFTMSLFIGALAFPTDEFMNKVRLGVLSGSLLAAFCGAAVILLARKPNPA
jgi:Na+:H+ antiporter, NhaA family